MSATSSSSSPLPVDAHKTVCATCQSVNGSERKFCRECGQRLWEPCAACQTPNAIDTTFCGHCGVRLADEFQRLKDSVQARADGARQLMAEGRFFEAQSHLRSIPASTDSRLQGLLSELRQLADGLTSIREEQTVKAEAAYERALQAMEQHRLADARAEMKAIPVGLLNPAMKDSIAQLETTWREIQTLTSQIRSALQSRQTEGLLPQVLRLLHLQPQDHQLQRLADQLAKQNANQASQEAIQALKRARALYQKRQYVAAGQEVAELDESQLNEESHRKTLRVIQDLATTVRILKSEPYVRSELSSLAQRWADACPEDEQATKLLQALRARLNTATQEAEFGTGWTKINPAIATKWETLWWRMPPKEMWPDESADLLRLPGGFFTAYGLALQGLGQSALSISILPAPKSMLGKWLPGTRSEATANDVWGLDMSSKSLKAVRLQYDKKAQRCDTKEVHLIAHGQPLDQASDDKQVAEIVADTLREWSERTEFKKGLAAVVGFPGKQSLGRWFELPSLKANKLTEAISYEAKMQIPIPLDDIEFDWHVWPTDPSAGRFQHVTLLAARRDHITQWLAPFQSLGIRVLGLQSTSLAFYNAGVRFRRPAKSGSSSDAAATGAAQDSELSVDGWLDLGADSTSLIIGNGRQLRFRCLNSGTQKIEQSLQRELQLTPDQAEQACRFSLKQTSLTSVDRILLSAIEDLLRPVRRSISSFASEGLSLQRLFVAGGGANQLGVLRQLTQAS